MQFTFRNEWLTTLANLPADWARDIILALIDYAATGRRPTDHSVLNSPFADMAAEIDRAERRRQRSAERRRILKEQRMALEAAGVAVEKPRRKPRKPVDPAEKERRRAEAAERMAAFARLLGCDARVTVKPSGRHLRIIPNPNPQSTLSSQSLTPSVLEKASIPQNLNSSVPEKSSIPNRSPMTIIAVPTEKTRAPYYLPPPELIDMKAPEGEEPDMPIVYRYETPGVRLEKPNRQQRRHSDRERRKFLQLIGIPASQVTTFTAKH